MLKRLPILLSLSILFPGFTSGQAEEKIPVAGITTLYRQNTHADVLLGRILETDTLDGKGRVSDLKLLSLYVDQLPDDDASRDLSKKHGFPLFDQLGKTLTLGTNELAVGGVVIVAEHGDYPFSDTGQTIYPKRRFFTGVFQVMQESGRVVPVFSDKHLADNWEDAKWIYDKARKMKIPLMAGSSVPSAWRYPPVDVQKGSELQELVVVAYGPMDAYGFHALEAAQALAERRKDGETGVKRVRCLTGRQIWKGGFFDRVLLDEALRRLKDPVLPKGKRIEDLVKEPVLFTIEYRDGLQVSVLILNGALKEFAAAWQYKGESEPVSTLFWLQPVRPYHHFAYLLRGIEKFMKTGKASWPVERTLLTTGLLDAVHLSKANGGAWLETPYLDVSYTSDWDWSQPPPPPPVE